MPFDRTIESLDIIQQLSDLPNEDDNLSAEELKKRFDKGVNILKEYVFSFIDELEGKQGADNIGYNGSQTTIGEALRKLEEAGVGTIPPDNTISEAKLQTGSVTEAKLGEELAIKINATKIKFGKITPTYTGDTTTDNGTSSYVSVDKWQEHNLGFKPSAVILFKADSLTSIGMPLNSTGSVSIKPYGLAMGERKSKNTNFEYIQYGGIATADVSCMCNSKHEVFKIDGEKIKTHLFKYYNSGNSSSDEYEIGTTDTLCYLAIA